MSGKIWIESLLLEKLPRQVINILRLAGTTAAEKSSKLYLVGGMVRDLLLDYPPEYDYDLVVIGDAGQFAALLQTQVGGQLTLYPRYLTATLKIANNLKLDLVTARRESYRQPAALPRVEAAGLKDDLYRRDFTVNALACSLLPADWGLLYDYHHGYEDLQHKMIRVFHSNSFFDDPLRLIRAIRFEQRYRFTIESRTFLFLMEAVKSEALNLVDAERLSREVKNIYSEPDPTRVLERLQQLGVTIDHPLGKNSP
jgi:tRNA nucleotidyltransferase (CCA-adding enzyme)